MTRLDKI